MNIVFYSHEIGSVSFVLTGKWRLPVIREALIKSLVFKDGIHETQPGKCLTELRTALSKLGHSDGVENQVVLTPPDLINIMQGKPPSKNDRWVMIEMPWGDIVVGGDVPTRTVSKQKWVEEWCDGNFE